PASVRGVHRDPSSECYREQEVSRNEPDGVGERLPRASRDGPGARSERSGMIRHDEQCSARAPGTAAAPRRRTPRLVPPAEHTQPDALHMGTRSTTDRPSMRQITETAGVSHLTVSRLLNGHPSIKEITRDNVLLAVEHLGYPRNIAARALALPRTLRIV